MSPRPTLCALGVIALASAPVCGQFVASHNSVGRIGSQTIVRPPVYTLGYGAFNPNFGAPAFVPGVGYGYYPNYTGLRPSYWSLPGRYNAYPWSGAGVYTGGTGIYAYYAPSLWSGSILDCGLATPYGPYVAGFGPYGGADYFNEYTSGTLYQADAPVGGYRPSWPAGAAAPGAPADRAILAVQAPSDAKVWVQGEEKGTDRAFTSPPLKPGQEYSYSVKAQWKVNDKTVEQSQTVSVRAGERSGLLFLSGRNVAAAPTGR